MKSERDAASNAPPRKPRFTPKIPPRKLPKTVVTKTEPSDSKADVVDKELLAKLNSAKSHEGFGRRMPKTERKVAPAQVAFGHGSSSLARSFGNPRGAVTGNKHEDGSDASAPKLKEYVEPWDYVRTYYPVTLPLRRPYSGDPEILNEEEFGGASASTVQDETAINPAEELGLMEPSIEPQMLLFQFPAVLPFAKPPAAAVDSSKGSGSKPDNKSKKGCNLKDLPAGFMGKMLVYKSGKIKMKLGDALFDVSPGANCACAQDVAVINVKEKHCCILGDLNKRAVVTPDVDSLLDSIDDMDL